MSNHLPPPLLHHLPQHRHLPLHPLLLRNTPSTARTLTRCDSSEDWVSLIWDCRSTTTDAEMKPPVESCSGEVKGAEAPFEVVRAGGWDSCGGFTGGKCAGNGGKLLGYKRSKNCIMNLHHRARQQTHFRARLAALLHLPLQSTQYHIRTQARLPRQVHPAHTPRTLLGSAEDVCVVGRSGGGLEFHIAENEFKSHSQARKIGNGGGSIGSVRKGNEVVEEEEEASPRKEVEEEEESPNEGGTERGDERAETRRKIQSPTHPRTTAKHANTQKEKDTKVQKMHQHHTPGQIERRQETCHIVMPLSCSSPLLNRVGPNWDLSGDPPPPAEPTEDPTEKEDPEPEDPDAEEAPSKDLTDEETECASIASPIFPAPPAPRAASTGYAATDVAAPTTTPRARAMLPCLAGWWSSSYSPILSLSSVLEASVASVSASSSLSLDLDLPLPFAFTFAAEDILLLLRYLPPESDDCDLGDGGVTSPWLLFSASPLALSTPSAES
ncbi:hypothetical protein CVT26_002487 [Gymnopilus dilepis]|uniref:Uncharacterized protein n=1 Tax=Gymnopilus dilepis TaxID=231916 RepID=A0A409Y3T2_9AGAR|nr:hypothetical protein CVT26_002487 [Gymnopilus dilepis]